jgi:hypothetical protein
MFRKDEKGRLRYTPENLIALKLTPNVLALARTVDATISASTEVTLNIATTFLSVYAIAKDIYLKWGADDVSASNFDEVIPAGEIRDFIVPDGVTAVNFIEREAGATLIAIEK